MDYKSLLLQDILQTFKLLEIARETHRYSSCDYSERISCYYNKLLIVKDVCNLLNIEFISTDFPSENMFEEYVELESYKDYHRWVLY